MNIYKIHTNKVIDCIVSAMQIQSFYAYRILLIITLLLTFLSKQTKADELIIDEIKNPVAVTYDEIPVPVYIGADHRFELNIIISSTDSVYVNTEELFKNLAIPCNISNNGNTLEGFVVNENNTYVIDFKAKQIKVGDKIFNPKHGLIKEINAIYVESSLLAEAFGITMTFNPRSLYLDLKTNIDFPIFKQQRLEQTRQNIFKIQHKQIAVDTVIKRNYHLFKFGMLDWGISSTQAMNEGTNNFARIGLGAELLYGEADFSVYYNDRYKFDKRQIDYLWRYVENDNKLIRQASVGKIHTQSIAFLNSPVVGASVTNSPTTLRKASGFYTISDYTEPNWTVELYINDQLVDFTTADASGLYIFKVPIVYGYTTLRLKFYGPLGEERSEERKINLPYSILPANEFEYTLSGGVLQDSSSSRFGKAELNYGLSRILTIAGGAEYLSSISTGTLIPYAKATLQPSRNLTLNAEYAYGVRVKARLSYYFWKNSILELNYTENTEGQQATIFNARQERRASLYIPFSHKRFSGYAKVDYTQLVYSELMYNQANIMISANYKNIGANNSTHLNWNSPDNLYITDDIALSARLNKGYLLRASAQYNVNENKFMTAKLELEKRIAKAYISVSYQRNMYSGSNQFNLNFRYDLPYATTSVSAYYGNDKVISGGKCPG